MAASPTFTNALRVAQVQILTANALRDGTGTLGTLLTAASTGSRVEHIDITAADTTTAGTVRLFLADGSHTYLWREIPVPANTVSATNPAWSTSLDFSAPGSVLVLPTGWLIKAGTEKAEPFNLSVFAGDF
jgi:phospholipase/lecithinase/hemolysin